MATLADKLRAQMQRDARKQYGKVLCAETLESLGIPEPRMLVDSTLYGSTMQAYWGWEKGALRTLLQKLPPIPRVMVRDGPTSLMPERHASADKPRVAIMGVTVSVSKEETAACWYADLAGFGQVAVSMTIPQSRRGGVEGFRLPRLNYTVREIKGGSVVENCFVLNAPKGATQIKWATGREHPNTFTFYWSADNEPEGWDFLNKASMGEI